MKTMTPTAAFRAACLATLCGLLTTATALAGTADTTPDPSKVQSDARPFGLDVVGPVMDRGSDDAAKEFNQDALPTLTSLLKKTLGERSKVDPSTMTLDPSKLQLQTASDVRVYFVGEGAGYQNSLGFNTTGSGPMGSDPKLIFPNASSPVSSYDPKQSADVNKGMPLMPGDFVDLGTFRAGTALDFFLISNGAQGGKNVFSTDASQNPDGLNHVVSFVHARKDSPYLIIGFEDMYGGGDQDFNDLIIAVDIGLANINHLLGTPEPAFMLTLGSFLGGVAWLKRRRNGNTPAATVSLA